MNLSLEVLSMKTSHERTLHWIDFEMNGLYFLSWSNKKLRKIYNGNVKTKNYDIDV